MTSIFNSSFSENLKRVNAKAERTPERVGEKTERGDKFSNVLAEVERKESKVKTPPTGMQSPAESLRTELVKSQSNSAPVAVTNVSFPSELYLTSGDPVYSLPRRAPECGLPECSIDSALQPLKSSGLQIVERGEETERPEVPVIRSMERISVKSASNTPIRYRRDEIEDIISTAGRYHGIDPTLSKAVAQAESSFKPEAVSQDGHASKGIFQLLDSTAGDLIGRFNMKEQYDAFDPAQNAYLGVGYLRRLHDIFSSETNLGGNLKTVPVKSADDLEKVALAAFNAGEGNVASAQRAAARRGVDPSRFENISPHLPPSTRAYVERVTQFRVQFAKNDGGSEVV